jgi:hypothetical protein
MRGGPQRFDDDIVFVTLTVELDPDSDPLCGRIAAAETGPAQGDSIFGNTDSAVTAGQRFTGWTEFSIAVEASVAQARYTGGTEWTTTEAPG